MILPVGILLLQLVISVRVELVPLLEPLVIPPVIGGVRVALGIVTFRQPLVVGVPVLAVLIVCQITQHTVLLLHPVALILILLIGHLVQLRHHVVQLLQIGVILLLAHRLSVGAGIAACQCRRLPHGVHHRHPALFGVLLGILLV